MPPLQHDLTLGCCSLEPTELPTLPRAAPNGHEPSTAAFLRTFMFILHLRFGLGFHPDSQSPPATTGAGLMPCHIGG
jgi:hypothetical protein